MSEMTFAKAYKKWHPSFLKCGWNDVPKRELFLVAWILIRWMLFYNSKQNSVRMLTRTGKRTVYSLESTGSKKYRIEFTALDGDLCEIRTRNRGIAEPGLDL